MIKRKKYLLDLSSKNSQVLFMMSKMIASEYTEILKQREKAQVRLIYPGYFHYASRRYLINHLLSAAGKKRKFRKLVCLFAESSYRIEKERLILKMGREWHYENDEMRAFFADRNQSVKKGNLMIVFEKDKWWAVFTYPCSIQKKSDDDSSDL